MLFKHLVTLASVVVSASATFHVEGGMNQGEDCDESKDVQTTQQAATPCELTEVSAETLPQFPTQAPASVVPTISLVESMVAESGQQPDATPGFSLVAGATGLSSLQGSVAEQSQFPSESLDTPTLTVTVTNPHTTEVTITSCSDNRCNQVTQTIETTLTNYVTTCPERNDLTIVVSNEETSTETITSCGKSGCSHVTKEKPWTYIYSVTTHVELEIKEWHRKHKELKSKTHKTHNKPTDVGLSEVPAPTGTSVYDIKFKTKATESKHLGTGSAEVSTASNSIELPIATDSYMAPAATGSSKAPAATGSSKAPIASASIEVPTLAATSTAEVPIGTESVKAPTVSASASASIASSCTEDFTSTGTPAAPGNPNSEEASGVPEVNSESSNAQHSTASVGTIVNGESDASVRVSETTPTTIAGFKQTPISSSENESSIESDSTLTLTVATSETSCPPEGCAHTTLLPSPVPSNGTYSVASPTIAEGKASKLSVMGLSLVVLLSVML